MVRRLACKFSSTGLQQSTNLPVTVSERPSVILPVSHSVSQHVSKSVRSVSELKSQSVGQTVSQQVGKSMSQ